MSKSQIDSATLVAAMFAGALGLLLLPGPFAWLASLGGLVLLLLLLSYDQDGYRSWFQSLAFSAVCGFCCAVASGAVLQSLAARGEIHLANGQWSTEWMPIGFVFASAVFLGIDRARMSSREPLEMRLARSRTAPPPGFIPREPLPRVAREATPPQPLERPLEQAVQPPAPQPAPVAPQYTAPVSSQTEAPEPVRPARLTPEPIVSQAVISEHAQPVPPRAEPLPAEPVGLGPAPIIPRTGKEAMIYVTLVGEGLNVLRSVKAEHLGRDFYRIVEPMPEGEAWEYQPGQVVRCKKKNLSSGKALVAIEEAPRAR